MILLIDICKEKLHYYEFVRPIEEILLKNKFKFLTKKYKYISDKDVNEAGKIIICGTSLKDNKFLDNLKYFKWIKEAKKPVMGICGGMQIISLIFEGKIKNGDDRLQQLLLLINQEANAINNLNQRYNSAMTKFDELTVKR